MASPGGALAFHEPAEGHMSMEEYEARRDACTARELRSLRATPEFAAWDKARLPPLRQSGPGTRAARRERALRAAAALAAVLAVALAAAWFAPGATRGARALFEARQAPGVEATAARLAHVASERAQRLSTCAGDAVDRAISGARTSATVAFEGVSSATSVTYSRALALGRGILGGPSEGSEGSEAAGYSPGEEGATEGATEGDEAVPLAALSTAPPPPVSTESRMEAERARADALELALAERSERAGRELAGWQQRASVAETEVARLEDEAKVLRRAASESSAASNKARRLLDEALRMKAAAEGEARQATAEKRAAEREAAAARQEARAERDAAAARAASATVADSAPELALRLTAALRASGAAAARRALPGPLAEASDAQALSVAGLALSLSAGLAALAVSAGLAALSARTERDASTRRAETGPLPLLARLAREAGLEDAALEAARAAGPGGVRRPGLVLPGPARERVWDLAAEVPDALAAQATRKKGRGGSAAGSGSDLGSARIKAGPSSEERETEVPEAAADAVGHSAVSFEGLGVEDAAAEVASSLEPPSRSASPKEDGARSKAAIAAAEADEEGAEVAAAVAEEGADLVEPSPALAATGEDADFAEPSPTDVATGEGADLAEPSPALVVTGEGADLAEPSPASADVPRAPGVSTLRRHLRSPSFTLSREASGLSVSSGSTEGEAQAVIAARAARAALSAASDELSASRARVSRLEGELRAQGAWSGAAEEGLALAEAALASLVARGEPGGSAPRTPLAVRSMLGSARLYPATPGSAGAPGGTAPAGPVGAAADLAAAFWAEKDRARRGGQLAGAAEGRAGPAQAEGDAEAARSPVPRAALAPGPAEWLDALKASLATLRERAADARSSSRDAASAREAEAEAALDAARARARAAENRGDAERARAEAAEARGALAAARRDAERALQDAADMREAVELARAEGARLRAALEGAEASAAEEAEARAAAVAEVEAAREALHERSEAEAEAAGLRGRLRDALAEREREAVEHQRLEARLEEAERDAARAAEAAASAQVQAARAEAAAAQAAKAQIEAARAEAEAAKAEVSEAEGTTSRLDGGSTALTLLQAELDEAVRARGEEQLALRAARGELGAASAEAEALRTREEEARGRLEAAREAGEAARRELAAAREELAGGAAEASAAAAELAVLRERAAEREVELETLRGSLLGREAELEAARGELAAAEAAAGSLQSQHHAQSVELDRLEEQIEQLTQALEHAVRGKRELESELAEAERNLTGLVMLSERLEADKGLLEAALSSARESQATLAEAGRKLVAAESAIKRSHAAEAAADDDDAQGPQGSESLRRAVVDKVRALELLTSSAEKAGAWAERDDGAGFTPARLGRGAAGSRLADAPSSARSGSASAPRPPSAPPNTVALAARSLLVSPDAADVVPRSSADPRRPLALALDFFEDEPGLDGQLAGLLPEGDAISRGSGARPGGGGGTARAASREGAVADAGGQTPARAGTETPGGDSAASRSRTAGADKGRDRAGEDGPASGPDGTPLGFRSWLSRAGALLDGVDALLGEELEASEASAAPSGPPTARGEPDSRLSPAATSVRPLELSMLTALAERRGEVAALAEAVRGSGGAGDALARRLGSLDAEVGAAEVELRRAVEEAAGLRDRLRSARRASAGDGDGEPPLGAPELAALERSLLEKGAAREAAADALGRARSLLDEAAAEAAEAVLATDGAAAQPAEPSDAARAHRIERLLEAALAETPRETPAPAAA